MARPTLMTHRKFARLTRSLGSKIVARGVLEILWDVCYEAGDDYLGTSDDIDQRLEWSGEPGVVAAALVACGKPEGHGFVEVEERNGVTVYRAHDLWHHAPYWVLRRFHPQMRELRKQYRRDRRAAIKNAEGTLSAAEWRVIVEAYAWRCAYCHSDLVEVTQDHVIPLSRGGRHDASNVIPACRSCNSKKGARTAEEFGFPQVLPGSVQ